jgi:hypothetical protein
MTLLEAAERAVEHLWLGFPYGLILNGENLKGNLAKRFHAWRIALSIPAYQCAEDNFPWPLREIASEEVSESWGLINHDWDNAAGAFTAFRPSASPMNLC